MRYNYHSVQPKKKHPFLSGVARLVDLIPSHESYRPRHWVKAPFQTDVEAMMSDMEAIAEDGRRALSEVLKEVEVRRGQKK